MIIRGHFVSSPFVKLLLEGPGFDTFTVVPVVRSSPGITNWIDTPRFDPREMGTS